jgi:hypothetical protein
MATAVPQAPAPSTATLRGDGKMEVSDMEKFLPHDMRRFET